MLLSEVAVPVRGGGTVRFPRSSEWDRVDVFDADRYASVTELVDQRVTKRPLTRPRRPLTVPNHERANDTAQVTVRHTERDRGSDPRDP